MAGEPEPVHPDEVRRRLDEVGYLVDEGLATALALALSLGQPLLLEGEPGVGKTAAAKALARAWGAPLLRLQCYEGVTAGEALYEWNYQRQLLAIRLAESHCQTLHDADLFTEEFLQERPILQAVRCAGPVAPVLLIDEIDRADDEFEALLFEFLGEASVTVPELGTFVAARRPTVVLTSNRSRDLHDALRRRCLYHWIEFPDAERVVAILRRSVPSAREPLVTSTAAFVGRVRTL
ncbi:MAG: MoxR family ATPase, partial [Actinomycetota bacterium]|nr:MoxR family ATPase [Actinomycetota bacterium]